MAIILRVASAPTADLSYIVLAFYALLGRSHVIQALALYWIFATLSPGIAADDPGVVIGRYFVFVSAAASIGIRGGFVGRNFRIRKEVLATLFLGLFLTFHSLVISSAKSVSVLKAVSWVVVMTTLIAAWGSLRSDERERLARQLYRGLVTVMVLSLPLLVLPHGYLRNGTGFQGIMDHPQAFGPAMAILAAWSAGLILGDKSPRWVGVFIVMVASFLVLLSEARTAGLAFIIGVSLAIATAPALSGRRLLDVLPGLRSPRIHFVIGLMLCVTIVASASLGARLANYLTKSGRAEGGSFVSIYEQSRGASMQAMWDNIQSYPVTGIGFGVASEAGAMEIRRDPILGLPVGASVEKGVLPLAVWEELGVLGLAFVAAWLVMVLRRGASAGVVPLAAGWTALLLNMGESTLFSPGAMGMSSLIILSWMLASGSDKAVRRRVGSTAGYH